MEPVRIVVIGSAFTPIFELGERIAEYHNLDFLTIEASAAESYDYFGDNIPAAYLDTGDLTSGSASQQYSRDPSDWAKMREMSEIYVDSPADNLSDEERFNLQDEHFCVVSSEIPDQYLATWADAVILLTTDESHAIEWINKRRVCGGCGAVYHLSERPTQRKGYCDRCGTHVFQVERDLPVNVRAQYRLWSRQLWSIETAMRKRGNYVKVDVDQFNSLTDIVYQVDRVLRKILKKPDEVNWNYSVS